MSAKSKLCDRWKDSSTMKAGIEHVVRIYVSRARFASRDAAIPGELGGREGIMSAFNSNAKTPEEHLANCQFQLDNVKGWLAVGQRECAAAKARCLFESADALVSALAVEKYNGGGK